MSVFDWDDECQEWSALPWLWRLKDLRHDFKATLFAIPGRATTQVWKSYPDWLDLAVHGWLHPDPYECQDWSRERMLELLDEPVVKECFVQGFKAPGWQISEGCYEGLLERGYWLADQPYNNDRRPEGLPVHLLGSPDHYHGHTHNVCQNGIEESWDEVVRLVREAESFEFVSEKVVRYPLIV